MPSRIIYWPFYSLASLYGVIVIYVCLTLLFILFRNTPTLIPANYDILPEDKPGFIVDTEGCRIPYLDPFDPTNQRFIRNVNSLDCHINHTLLVGANDTSIFTIESALPAFKIKNTDELECCYQPLWKPKPNEVSRNQIDNLVMFARNCTSFKRDAMIKEEFVRVICSSESQEIYRTIHGFVHLKQNVEERCKKVTQKLSNNSRDRLSVLVLGIDSVSRLNFHRQMPKTVKLLKKLHAIELLGYNKVHGNTFPNWIPLLSGFSMIELKHWNNCNWIWKNYSDAGYRTAFGEDTSIFATFNYQGIHFHEQPTDYYLRPLMTTAEKEIGHKFMEGNFCTGSQMTFSFLLQYVSKFVNTMSSIDAFAFFWSTTLTHNYFNYPSLGDEPLEKFITEITDSGSLHKTLFIILSDHGLGFGEFRNTYQGHLEERLPFVFFVFPQWFRNLYPKAYTNLKINTQRLTSPYDMYETFVDIINLQRLEDEAIETRSIGLKNAPVNPRGISLFLPVPKSRTCEQAGIDNYWCTCQESKPLSLKTGIVQNISMVIVKYLNSLLKPFTKCSKLQLAKIKRAEVKYSTEYHQKKEKGLRDYVIALQSTPGNGMFEATVRHNIGNNSVSIIGNVSRINAYGNQSSCIDDHHMHPYCYCIR